VLIQQGESNQCPAWNQSTPAGPPRLRLPQGDLVFLPARAAASRSKKASFGTADVVATLTGDGLSAKSTGRTAAPIATTTKLVPSSPLITNPRLRIKLGNMEWAGHTFTLLIAKDASVGPRLLALVSSRQGVPSGDASYHWFPVSDHSARPDPLDLAALEHLYRLAVNHVATDKFRLSLVKEGHADARPAPGTGMTHSQLLAHLASARQCIAVSLAAAGEERAKPWRTVNVEPVPMEHDQMSVAARVSDMNRPLAGAVISFFREPHLDCSARSDRTGRASCRLEDSHGHGEDGHADPEHGHVSARTIATYPGEVRTEVLLLPTTAVWQQ
jgi:hypothetical protein